MRHALRVSRFRVNAVRFPRPLSVYPMATNATAHHVKPGAAVSLCRVKPEDCLFKCLSNCLSKGEATDTTGISCVRASCTDQKGGSPHVPSYAYKEWIAFTLSMISRTELEKNSAKG